MLAFNFFNYYGNLQPQILSVHSSCPTIVRVSLDMFTILLHLFAALVVDDKCALRALYEIGVYIFFLINICSSLFDEANKIKSLNIER